MVGVGGYAPGGPGWSAGLRLRLQLVRVRLGPLVCPLSRLAFALICGGGASRSAAQALPYRLRLSERAARYVYVWLCCVVSVCGLRLLLCSYGGMLRVYLGAICFMFYCLLMIIFGQ